MDHEKQRYARLAAAARAVVEEVVIDEGHRWASIEREYIEDLRAALEAVEGAAPAAGAEEGER